MYELMKKCSQLRNFKELDEALELKVKPFLYNEGEGKKVPIAQLIFMRNLDRFPHNQLPEIKALGLAMLIFFVFFLRSKIRK